MSKICYLERNFSDRSLERITQANSILDEYAAQGFVLTLRQLYYQFVSRGLLPNTQREYKNLGSLVNDARLAGFVDWTHLEDRTRNLKCNSHWRHPASIVKSSSEQFMFDKWARQETRIEVWIEKEALAGIFDGICAELDVPYFCCRGYTSQSEMWSASQRLLSYKAAKQRVVILHFGDHDPSGIDMSRDIEHRLEIFTGGQIQLKRLALNMSQIEQYNPPPNPAKETDSRHGKYVAEYGHESWELDALEPSVLVALVSDAVAALRDEHKWTKDLKREKQARLALKGISDSWNQVLRFLSDNGLIPNSRSNR
jgi:hypothetical protein